MDIKSLLEEYREVQRTRSIQRLAKKTTAALIQFKNVRFQQGSDPSKEDITINIRQGIFPDLGVIVFRNKTSIIFTLEGSFDFHDWLESDAELKIVFEEGEDKEISLVFPNKNQKEEFVGVIRHYLGLSNCSSPDPENPPSNS